jgi:hypothetical protein
MKRKESRSSGAFGKAAWATRKRKKSGDEYDWFDSGPVFRGKLRAAAIRADENEHIRRTAFADQCVKNEQTRVVRMHFEGTLLTVERSPLWAPHESASASKRGKVHGFSRKSRQRFLTFVAKLRRTVLPLFVTLTYPEWWPEEWATWKDDLDTFIKNHVQRKWPKAAVIWKLEPQKRGAPHFHLMIFGVPYMPKEWLAQTWYEVAGTNDPKHLQAGTKVERARSFRGVMCYAGKKYMGKEFKLPPGWESVGRFWGAYGRDHFPESKVMEFKMTVAELHRFRRLVRRFFASKGKVWRSRNGVNLFTQEHLQWARALDWAATGSCQPMDFRVPLAAQPF